MWKREASLLCVALLLWPLSAPAARAAQTPVGDSGPTPRQSVAEIPAGAVVEVRLHNKATVRGQLGAVTDSGFEVRNGTGAQLQIDTVAFQDVKSVKVVGSPLFQGVVQAPPAGVNSGSAWRESFAKVASGAIVEIKLQRQPTVRGRLGTVSDSGVEVQRLKNGHLETDTLALRDVKSVKIVKHEVGRGTKILVAALAVVGGILLISVFARNTHD